MPHLLHDLSLPVLACAALLMPPAACGRELAALDALADAPLRMQPGAASASASASASATPFTSASGPQPLPARVQWITREERLGLPTFVQLRPVPAPAGSIRSQAGRQDAAAAARSGLKGLASLYGLSDREVDAAPLHHMQSLGAGARLVRLSNQRDGIEVFREQATVLLDAQGQATAIGGYLGSTALAPVLPSAGNAGAARLGPADAAARALRDFDFLPGVASKLQRITAAGPANAAAYQRWTLPDGVVGADGARLLQPVRTKPVWFRMPQGLVGAFYVELQVHEKGQVHAYAYVVAADDGRLLLRNPQISHAQSFQFRAWADPSTGVPLPGPQGRSSSPHPTGVPDGFAPALVPSSLVTAANAQAPWLPDGATLTQGNNVQAFADLAPPRGLGPVDADECAGPVADDFRACATAPGIFDHPYDHARHPLADKGQAAASVVNLFYVSNWLHDWFYEAGFDEAAGNAQADNFGRPGLDGDALVAQALDSAMTSNASMLTPADGSPPRMSMYNYVNADARLSVQAPASIAGSLMAAGAEFGPPAADAQGGVALAEPADACASLANPAAIAGRFALVSETGCRFDRKARMAQLAGAIGVLIVSPEDARPQPMGVAEPGLPIHIPTVRISRPDGDRLLASLSAQEAVTLRLQQSTVHRSSALDNSIVLHEWGHYISNRLIGDANGLNTNHARGLGEGWGDFHALLIMAAAQDRQQAGNDAYQGAYATAAYAQSAVQAPAVDALNVALYGLRRYPYSTDMAKNPLTFRHIQSSATLPAVPAPGFIYDNAQAHNMGEVWATMLWECYVALLNAHPFQEAQLRMRNYLVAGYKLTPINPVLTEARDALLAAALAVDPADHQRFAQAFARRGAGSWAQPPHDRYSLDNEGVLESYTVSGRLEAEAFTLSMADAGSQRCDQDPFLDSGETAVLRLTLRNTGAKALEQAQVHWSASLAGLEFPDGTQTAVPLLQPGESTEITSRLRLRGLMVPTLGRITAAFHHPDQPQGSLANHLVAPMHLDLFPTRSSTDSADAPPSAMSFGSTSARHADSWGTRTDASPNRFYAATGPDSAGSHWMQTPLLQVAGTGDFTVSFRHRHVFEADAANYYDGGQLMLSTDDGGTWARVDGLGYNGTLAEGSGNPAQGEPAFVADSAGWPDFLPVSVNLGTAYAGRAVRLAWVMHSDEAFGSPGWQVDDIVFTGITNTPFPQAVADAQACTGPSAAEAGTQGTPQSTPVHTPFAQPLLIRLSDANGQPLAGRTVTFTAPASGASARLAAGGTNVQAVTDAQGIASVTATANGLDGSYTVAAVGGGVSAGFALRNTPATQGPGPGSSLAFNGASPGGQGLVELAVHGALQPLPAQARYSQSRIASEAATGVPPLPGHLFPFGLASFVLEDVGQGNAVTFHIRYPAPVPDGAEYWKYGPTTPSGAPHWHRISMARTDARTVAITLTDGGTGDTDAMADGRLTDPGGLAVPALVPPSAATPIPLLPPVGLAMLSLCLAGLACTRLGRRLAPCAG